VSVPQDLIGFSDVWLDFVQRHPEVALEMEPTNRYVDVVGEGFDVALRAGTGQDDTLIARRVGDYHLVAVASPSYVETYGRLRDPAELRLRSCVLLAPLRKRPGFPERPPLPLRHVVCGDVQFALSACLAGIGVAVLPEAKVQADVRAGRLIPVLETYNPLTVPLYAVFPERAHQRTAVAAFVDVVTRHFKPRRRRA
jgi:DNA-binding transcriptional LysR family regulator